MSEANLNLQNQSAPLNPSDGFEKIPLVLTVEDLTGILHVGRSAAYELVRSGQLKCIRVGKSIRIPRHELLRFLGEVA